MISHFSKKLNFERNSLRYNMKERGRIRSVFVFLSELENLETKEKTYGVRIDRRINRNIWTDAPLVGVEYIDADELPKVIEFINTCLNTIMVSDVDENRYTEYRFYTRGGIMLECYTGLNRWRFAFNYKLGLLGTSNLLTIDKNDTVTYINDLDDLSELRGTLQAIQKEIEALEAAK